MRCNLYTLLFLLLCAGHGHAQSGLVDMSRSGFSRLGSTGMSDVRWTTGFWAERFTICRDIMVPELWNTYTSDSICHAFSNFRIAAGMDTGRFRGPSFHDGDFYKTIEALAAMFAITRDPKLDRSMDDAIAVIGKAQRTDGYIYTKNIIDQRKTGTLKNFDDQLSFEAYNFGHLMTAACVHKRSTGKNNLLGIAVKAADFLIGFYSKASPEQARNAICPSHYMGLAELARTTGEKRFLDLLSYLLTIRGTVEGTDDNSDRAPFRAMTKVVGHAVRANYLFAGAADLFAETGDSSLYRTLLRLWDNVSSTKIYVTGGCGALYDGVSVDGTAYRPDTVQKVHQSYGRDYQLPNHSAHNETCANIGNMLWNWRMFLLSGDAKYMDMLELSLYNSVLSGVSLDGHDYFYTNPLAASSDYPYQFRWTGGRVPYISKSNCCPPNLVRTIAEVQAYAYSIGADALYVNLYGGSVLDTRTRNGEPLTLEQQSDYPWNGTISLRIGTAPQNTYGIMLRIPAWCGSYTILLNDEPVKVSLRTPEGYVELRREWKTGDRIRLDLSMPVTLIESHPLVEETRNQVAIKRGPVVYCLESPDIKNIPLNTVSIPSEATFTREQMYIGAARIISLTTEALQFGDGKWTGGLYRQLNTDPKPVRIRMIPYYAWANRGRSDMAVWLPLIR
jgi:hypothetical protein